MRIHPGLVRFVALGFVALGFAACRPKDILSVPAPAGVLASGALENQSGAEGALGSARAQLAAAVDGYSNLITWTGLLTDEFTFSAFSVFGGIGANVDARATAGAGGFGEVQDLPWEYLLQARSALLLALPGLKQYEPANGRSKVGEAYALAGYAELLTAEAYCAGTPLDQVLSVEKGFQYGTPLSTDSLLGMAQSHFDSAVVETHGDAMVSALADVGLGRVLLDRGQYQLAAAAVASVPTSFVYNDELEPTDAIGATQYPNLYAFGIEYSFARLFNVGDYEGANGLGFVSAHDPRLELDTTSYQTPDGTPWRLPTKFEANLSYIPLATGIEARLIQTEAALKRNDVPAWAGALRALRADSTNTHVTFPATDSLPADSAELASSSAQVDLMFRERAFWLFGTGARLGDLRRLVRQYGRDEGAVFPTGPYAPAHQHQLPSPLPNYGTDVTLALPTPYGLSSNGISETNPNYKGCLTSTKTA